MTGIAAVVDDASIAHDSNTGWKSWPGDITTVLANSAPSQSNLLRSACELISTKLQEYSKNTVHLSTIN